MLQRASSRRGVAARRGASDLAELVVGAREPRARRAATASPRRFLLPIGACRRDLCRLRYVEFPAAAVADVVGSASRTLCAWAAIDAFDGGGIFAYGASQALAEFGLRTNEDASAAAGSLVVQLYETDVSSVTLAGADDGGWHHYCLSYEGTSGRPEFLAAPADLEALHAAGVDALEVTVVVANFLGGVSAPAAPLVVEIRRDAPPVLEVVGGVALAAYRPDALSVRAEAIATSCDGREAADRAVAITWRLFDDAGGLADLASTSNDQRYFKLPAYSLEAATIYALEATAVDVVGGANATQTVALSVGTSPVVAVLAGGDRVVPAAAALDVDASGSYDGDVEATAPSTLTFAWACDDAACDAALGDSQAPKRTVDLAPGTYAIAVTATAPDGRAGAAAATYVVAAEPAPVVAVDGPAGRVAATSRVVLYGLASHGGGGNVTTAWRLAAGNLAGDAPLGAWARTALRDSGPLDGLRRHDLALEPRALVAGAAYSFALDAAAGGAVGGASVTIYASRPPSSGVVEAAPPRGVALETRFELRTSSWASEDPPLRPPRPSTSSAGPSSPNVCFVLVVIGCCTRHLNLRRPRPGS